jgi:pterin-4a-carbinolamine dehydratase
MRNYVVMVRHRPALLRGSIFSSFQHSRRQYSCGDIIYGKHVSAGKIPTIPITSNSSRCQLVFCRWSHNQIIDEQKTEPDEKRKVDPFAKRPSQKCDPYGLAGQSLSHNECLHWLDTLECGWKLIGGDTDDRQKNLEKETPIFLQKKFYHATFHDASRFLSQISLLSTNLNHYPFLSMERVLVDDLNSVSNSTTTHRKSTEVEQDATCTSAQSDKQKRTKVKGWLFVSTVRCSTYRPPTTRVNLDPKDGWGQNKDKGLTYHDFHLAMNIDIECNREGFALLL